jgi:hypothetical protein
MIGSTARGPFTIGLADDDVFPPKLSVMFGATGPHAVEDLHIDSTALEVRAHKAFLVRSVDRWGGAWR